MRVDLAMNVSVENMNDGDLRLQQVIVHSFLNRAAEYGVHCMTVFAVGSGDELHMRQERSQRVLLFRRQCVRDLSDGSGRMLLIVGLNLLVSCRAPARGRLQIDCDDGDFMSELAGITVLAVHPLSKVAADGGARARRSASRILKDRIGSRCRGSFLAVLVALGIGHDCHLVVREPAHTFLVGVHERCAFIGQSGDCYKATLDVDLMTAYGGQHRAEIAVRPSRIGTQLAADGGGDERREVIERMTCDELPCTVGGMIRDDTPRIGVAVLRGEIIIAHVRGGIAEWVFEIPVLGSVGATGSGAGVGRGRCAPFAFFRVSHLMW